MPILKTSEWDTAMFPAMDLPSEGQSVAHYIETDDAVITIGFKALIGKSSKVIRYSLTCSIVSLDGKDSHDAAYDHAMLSQRAPHIITRKIEDVLGLRVTAVEKRGTQLAITFADTDGKNWIVMLP